jgi:hypothetical protein
MDPRETESFGPHPRPIQAPTRFRRIAKRGFTWDLPRSFPGYFADRSIQMVGAATKYVIRTNDSKQPDYLIKYPQKANGRRETYTEFFINRLGLALGLPMAHSGLVLVDGSAAFITKIFTSAEETLRHGSLIIEDCFKKQLSVDARELDEISRRSEQAFYSIDFVANVLQQYCGPSYEGILPMFVEMLVFDALIGSMDRHSQNWGLLARTKEPIGYRFAPIFDSSRALLWNLDDEQVNRMSRDETAIRSYVNRARPCLGPVRNHPKVNACNHFDFILNLVELYPQVATKAVLKLSDLVHDQCVRLLGQFPFDRGFTSTRKRLIIKILDMRADRLMHSIEKGGALR